MSWIYLIAGIACAFFVLRLFFASRPAVSLTGADAEVAAGRTVLVDVREPAEWGSGVAEHARLLPLSDLRGARKRWGPALSQMHGKKIMLYCQSGARSGLAAAQLRKEGFDAVNVGSLMHWKQSGGAVTMPADDA